MFNRKLKERIEALEIEVNTQKKVIKAYGALLTYYKESNRLLLSHLNLHEVTEPSIPEKRKLLTEGEYKEYCEEKSKQTSYRYDPQLWPKYAPAAEGPWGGLFNEGNIL